jgi:TetR/AcrR family transcriptional regulator, tetracycline repressor protein
MPATARMKDEPRRRGRPARLSRDQVVETVIRLLEREPRALPTIARVAVEIGAVPAALYRHFESQDDLFDSVLARVLSSSEAQADPYASWQEQLEAWMHGLRRHLLRYPAVIALIGRTGRTSPAWLDASSALVEILGRAGLEGRELALTYLWVLETTVGLVWQEASMPLSEQIANAGAARGELSELTRARFAPIEAEMANIDGESFFATVIERTTAGIALRRTTRRSD